METTRSELRTFYDNDENINESVITLNVFIDKFTSGINILKYEIEHSCQFYKEYVSNNQLLTPENIETTLQMITDALNPFNNSLSQMNENIQMSIANMKKLVPQISNYLHNFNHLQKERTRIKNKTMFQSSEAYENEITLFNEQINETLQNYSTRVKLYNDGINDLQIMIRYLDPTDSSSQSVSSNQFILNWDSVKNDFENLITLISNDSQLNYHMRNSLLTFRSNIQSVHLIKLRELKDTDNEMKAKDILIEKLKKQISDLSTKNLKSTETGEVSNKNLVEIPPIDLRNEHKLKIENDELKEKVKKLTAENEELEKQFNDYVSKYNEARETHIQNEIQLREIIDDQKNDQKTKIDNLVSEYEEKLTELTRENNKLINKNNQLEKKIDEDDKEYDRLLTQLNEQVETINSLKRERDNLIQQLTNDFEDNKRKLLSESQELRDQLSTVELQLKQNEKINDNLKVDLQKLQEINKRQEEKIATKTAEHVRTDFHARDLKEQVKSLNEKVLTLENEKQNWNQKEIQLKQEYEVEKSKNESLESRIKDLENELSNKRVSDESQSKADLKRRLQPHTDNTVKRYKLDIDYWDRKKRRLDFTESHVIAKINNIEKSIWNQQRKKMKATSQMLNKLHDDLAKAYKRFEIAYNLRNKDERSKKLSNEINDIINEIRTQSTLKKTDNVKLESIISEINENCQTDIKLHENSQSVYMNLFDTIKRDVPEKDERNSRLKELQQQITERIERFNQRNEKMKELLFKIQSHLVSNIYSQVNNELLIDIDRFIDEK